MEKHGKETVRTITRTPREMRLVLALLVLSTWLLFSASSFASESGEMKRVLILYSFRYGLSGNELMDANKVTSSAIQATMEEGMAHEIAIYSERMDISALSENRYFEELRDAYRKKYDGQPIDLIIAVNYRALNFLISHGEEIWPKTSILFCGVEEGRREQLKQLRSNITGLFADARFGDMLDTIFKIHPDTQQLTVVVGTSETERFIEARVRRAFREYVGRADFTSLSNFEFDAILSRVADLPPKSIVLFLTLFQDGKGKPVPENALPLISRVSNAPVYGLFDVYVGHGIVGGSVYSVENRGIMIGKMGVRILTGEKPRDIPVGTGQKHFSLYDWRQLKRWGISESDLPQGSIIRYREPSFYELYYWYIWGGISLVLFQAVMIIFLLINRARRHRVERELLRAHRKLEEANIGLKNEITERKQTEKELHESEERYRSLVNESPAAILVFQDGHFIFTNPAGLRLLGCSDLKDFVGRPALDFIPPTLRDPMVQRMENLAQGESNPTVEIELLKTDGTIISVETTSVPIQIGGNPAGLIICNDITQRKLAEMELLKSQENFRNLAGKLLSVQEAERRRLAREMHDDLTQHLAVLAIEIGKMERKFQDSEDPVLETLRSIRERLVNLSGDVHAISRQLHPSIIDDLGLVDAIKSECRTFTRREGIAVDYRSESMPPRISADVAICIYRIVQEGLRNVAKHADTTQLQISLTGKDDSIHLTIKDQGVGFDPKEIKKKLGLGHVSMQERVRLIQGDISIESRPGKGTVINVRAPADP
jgi:PAS domain S-box-containing protein